MASRSIPQPPPSFNLTASEILCQTTDLIASTTFLEDALVSSLTPSTATFSSLLTPILNDDHAVSKKTLIIRLFSSVSEDKDLRDASRTAEEMLLKANSASLMRKDIAALVKAVYEKNQRGEESLSDEDAYTLFKMHRAYQNTGAGIEDEVLREKYKAAVQERNEVLLAAKKTISESDDGIYFTRPQLNGVPSSILDVMKVNDEGLLKATFKKGHLISIMKHATSASTRKAYHIAKESRFPENVARLERAVELRNSTARMLGFKTHAELKMEDKMAKSVDSVISMLNKLRTELKPLADREMETLFRIKKTYIEEHGTDESDEDLSRLNAWDWAFYARILEKERYSVDSLLISEYFEVNHSLKGMLRIFEEIFGMVFIPDDGAPVWQKDVTVYEAWNSKDQGGEFLGYLYLDLYAREGKYAGAHSSLIQPGFTTSNNKRHYPSSSLVTSLLHTPGRPTLLLHSELKTMFHELGHAIHKLVTHTKHYHGCSRDFVEIPSILLENWIWVPSVLRRLGKHYSYLNDEYLSFWKTQKSDADQRPEEELPEKLTLDLAKTKHVNGAHAMLHQVFLALFDLTIHNADETHPVDTTKLWNESKTEIMGLGRADSIGQASFAHPFRGYDAAYFTYALSKVYATDLWVSQFKADPMHKETGLRYRQHVLQPGGSQPELKSLSNFLGREPNDEAYYSEVTSTPGRQVPERLTSKA
ncbi:prd1- ase yscd [Fusarium longipes]|uniref:Prd1-ase yscd n=1 Tax=Fusarium longipes TaxID=694270 RepID=A0A395RL81_9HYPO|nr:prd1- ase yscd [Fusarium longipes]